MDLIKIAEEAFATGKQHIVSSKVTKNVYSCTVVLLSRFPVMETKSVSLYAKCLVP